MPPTAEVPVKPMLWATRRIASEALLVEFLNGLDPQRAKEAKLVPWADSVLVVYREDE